jgi:hypothetical protein
LRISEIDLKSVVRFSFATSMPRNSSSIGPRLEALLDERDQLRVQISLAADDPSVDQETILTKRLRLKELERDIAKHWRTAADS